MDSSGSKSPELIIVGEAPGAEEDKLGEPFVGPSGNYLRSALKEVGVDIRDVMFTNIVRCRPPNNKVSKKAINECYNFTIQEIEDYQPEQVWLMGNTPLNAVLGESGITNWNGSIIENNGITYIPLYHPAYILRNGDALDEWLSGMMKAVDGDEKAEDFERYYPKTIDDLVDMDDYLAGFDFISFDAETSTLRAFEQESMIVSVSFAAGKRSYSYPIYHTEEWWGDDIERVEGITLQILQEHSERLIGQNIKFDFMQARNQWDACLKAGGDTMLISHLLDSRPGLHGLKRLAGIHLGWYEYERDLWDYAFKHPKTNPKKGGSFANMPLDILLPYGAMDAEATLLLHDILYEKMSDKQKILYDQLILQASDALTNMQCNGIALDRYIAKRYQHIYTIMRDRVHDEIDNDPKVKTIVKRRQAAIDKEIEGTKRKRKIFRFNPGSFMQLQELYFEEYNIPVVARTDKGAPSTAGSAYRPLEPKYPILHKVRIYKLFNKMLSTYLSPAANGDWSSSLDDRVRTNFNLHGTVTGRTSSSDPVNLQNIPTPEKEPGTLLEILPIKNIFTHSYQQVQPSGLVEHDGVIMSVDYSGMELRVFASLANCEPMLEIHRSGRDFHTMVASMISGIPYEDIDKPTRYVYKWTNWTLLYGGDAYTLHRLYDIPMSDAERAVVEYYRRFPEVRDYQDDCVDFAEDHGYAESPYGRRMHLPWILDRDTGRRNKAKREAVNMPVQSGAGDTLLAALVVVDDKIIERGLDTKTVNEVHDSIVLDVPLWEVDQVAELCVDAMENIKGYGAEYFPDIDFSWLKAPLKADVEVGTHYGAEIPYEQWLEEQS
jgi:DNA polymerase-1